MAHEYLATFLEECRPIVERNVREGVMQGFKVGLEKARQEVPMGAEETRLIQSLVNYNMSLVKGVLDDIRKDFIGLVSRAMLGA